MMQLILALIFCASLFGSALAQGGMGPGPGTVHSTGGGSVTIVDGAINDIPLAVTNTVSTSLTLTAGADLLAVGISFSGVGVLPPTAISATYNGASMTAATSTSLSANDGVQSVEVVWYCLKNPTTGSAQNLVVNWTNNSAGYMWPITFSGTNASVATACGGGVSIQTSGSACPTINITAATGQIPIATHVTRGGVSAGFTAVNATPLASASGIGVDNSGAVGNGAGNRTTGSGSVTLSTTCSNTAALGASAGISVSP